MIGILLPDPVGVDFVAADPNTAAEVVPVLSRVVGLHRDDPSCTANHWYIFKCGEKSSSGRIGALIVALGGFCGLVEAQQTPATGRLNFLRRHHFILRGWKRHQYLQ